MATIHEVLTPQVNGITDTFTTANDISDGLIVDWNGQVVNPADITVLTSNSFQLSFVPQSVPTPKDTLAIFITPDQYCISDQVDGIKLIFNKAASDNNQGNFVAILNGQILADDTVTLSSAQFGLPVAPDIGDELCYIRVIVSEQDVQDVILPITGIIRDEQNLVANILNNVNISANLSDVENIKCVISDGFDLRAVITDNENITAKITRYDEGA